MKLPRRGCLFDDQGRIVWAWEHNDPTTDFEVLPPTMINFQTGEEVSIATPVMKVLDLEEVAQQEDVPSLYREMHTVRVERTDAGSYCFKQRITNSAGDEATVDHPLMARINARRRLNNLPTLPSTPDRISRKE